MRIDNPLLRNPQIGGTDLSGVLDPKDMTNLQSQVVGAAIQQQDLINASIAAGGPASLNDAIIQAMDFCKVSLEKLSKKTNVSKYRLNKMLSGEMDLPPKILARIMKVFHHARPDIYPGD